MWLKLMNLLAGYGTSMKLFGGKALLRLGFSCLLLYGPVCHHHHHHPRLHFLSRVTSATMDFLSARYCVYFSNFIGDICNSICLQINQNQSIKTHLYSATCCKRIRGACWAGLGRVFTFAARSVKQLSFQSTSETTERLS